MVLINTKSRGLVVRIFYYKSIGLNHNKQIAVAVASFHAILHLELSLHRQNLSVAWAS